MKNLPLIETQVLFRPSEIGLLMTNSRTKGEVIGQTAINRLIEKAIEIRYGRYKDFSNKYVVKGKEVEEDSITAYSLIKNKVFLNNKVRVTNDMFTGEIDLPWIENGKTVEITDVKSSYSVHTFYNAFGAVDKGYIDQGCGYLDLFPDAKKYNIAYLLVNNSMDGIMRELDRITYSYPDFEVPAYVLLRVLKEHVFDKKTLDEVMAMRNIQVITEKDQEVYESFVEIPLSERMIEHSFNREELEPRMEEIRERMNYCREWLFENMNIKHVG